MGRGALIPRLGRKTSGRPARGATDQRLDAKQVSRRLAELGDAGRVAGELDRRLTGALGSIVSLSPLTSPLAVEYVERVGRPMAAMSVQDGALLVVRGYMAHLLVEEDPAAFSVSDIPVLGDLPPPDRRGRPPRDLLIRVVKATRRQFPAICALDPTAWEGLVLAAAGHAHARSRRGTTGGQALDTTLVDGLLRTGWVLRQVDIAYGLGPERS